MKRLHIAIVCVLFLTPISKGGWLYFSERELSDFAENGNIIVRALNAYHGKKGCYPKKLEELMPVYLKKIPPASAKSERAFNYLKIPEDHPRKDEYYYGFSLTIGVSCWHEVLTSRTGKILTYQPSERYPLKKYTKPKRLIGRWVHMKVFRSYRDLSNPLILKDGMPIFLDE